MSIVVQTDREGYLLPWTGDDEVLECVEALNDPDYGDPAAWPSWTDEALWEPGPDPLPDTEYVPSEADLRDYAEWATEYEDRMWAARIEADGHLSDRDVMIATGCVG